jgi:hypothetical protein
MSEKAFPVEYKNPESEGMDLRDYFAAKALQGCLANPNSPYSGTSMLEMCYRAADAMIRIRENKND